MRHCFPPKVSDRLFVKKNTNFLSLCWSGSWVVVYWIKNVDRLHLYCGSRQMTFKKIRHLRLVLLLLACQYEFVWEEWPVCFTFVWICYIRIHLILILFKGSDGSSGGGGGGGGGSGGGSGSASASVRSSSRRTSEEPHIGKYRLLKTIGKGNFAKVKLAKHIPTGKEVRSTTVQFLILSSSP